MGRVTSSTTNAQADPTSTSVPGIASTTLAYDAHGHLATTTQGTFTQGTAVVPRTYTYGYDAHGYTSSTVDPLANATTLVNNLAGEPTDTVTPDGNGGTRDLVSSYDGDGNLTSLTLPKGEEHELTYTPADALASYDPPRLGRGQLGDAVRLHVRRSAVARVPAGRDDHHVRVRCGRPPFHEDRAGGDRRERLRSDQRAVDELFGRAGSTT